MSGIGIIANPHSKLNKRNPGRQELLSYILGEKGQISLTSDLDELAKTAEDFHKRGISLLAINGGDGTISCTLTAFLRAYGSTPLPPVVVLKGGTMNVLAANLGIRGTPEQVLFRLVEAYSSGAALPTQTCNSLMVDSRIGFVFANGAAVNFLRKFYANKTGPWGVLALFAQTALAGMFGLSQYKDVIDNVNYDLRLDGLEEAGHSSVCLMAATLPYLPFGARMFANVRDGDGRFELVSVTTPAKNLIWRLARYVVKNWKDPDLKRWLLKEAVIDTHHHYTLDGEIFETKNQTVKIETGPKFEFVII